MNRGLAHRPIFESVKDMRFFLSRLAHAVRRGELEVHAWCLMHTHFHLLVFSPAGKLDVALRRIQHEHSRRFNWRRGRDGPLYHSRFTSRLVDTYAYRCVLISYIDWNPVDAKIVVAPSLYEHGSAFWYSRPEGPCWMTRTWVEREVCDRRHVPVFDAADYPGTFGPRLTPATKRLIELRLSHPTSLRDPIDDLLALAPPEVSAWLVERARLADGVHLSLPITDTGDTLDCLRRERATEPTWLVRPTRKASAAWDLLEAGLLRDLCGATVNEIAHLTSRSASTVCEQHQRHRIAMEMDPQYAARAGLLAKRLMSDIFRTDAISGQQSVAAPGGSRP